MLLNKKCDCGKILYDNEPPCHYECGCDEVVDIEAASILMRATQTCKNCLQANLFFNPDPIIHLCNQIEKVLPKLDVSFYDSTYDIKEAFKEVTEFIENLK